MSNFVRPELHVAQQSRRDKLRVQQNAITHHHLGDQMEADDYSGTENLEQFSAHHQEGLVNNPDFMHQLRCCRYGNISYDPSQAAIGLNNLQSDKGMAHQDDVEDDDDSLTNLPPAVSISSSPYSFSGKGSGDPQNCGPWKSVGSQQICDWNIASYASGSAGIENNTNQLFVGVGLSGGMKLINNSSVSSVNLKSSYLGSHEVHSSFSNASVENSSLKQFGDAHFGSPSLYQNTLQDVVSSANLWNQDGKMLSFAHQSVMETARGGSWMDGGNELVLLPTNSDQSARMNLSCSSDLVGRSLDGCHQWIGQLDYPENRISDRDLRPIANDSCSSQVLSLSLSSVPPSRMHVDQVPERDVAERFQSGSGCFGVIAEANPQKVANKSYFSNSKELALTDSHQDVVAMTPSFSHRNVGPLGPFTGYATILGSSKFLRPALQLLEEFCNGADPKPIRSCQASGKSIMDLRVSVDDVNTKEPAVRALAGDSGGSSSTFYSSNDEPQEAGGSNSSSNSFRPEYLQKKAKLLYMHDEVCRRYKQYHQQMQMVVSSFESVAGLSTATPYISLAVKTITRHFRCLKNSISDQLRNIKKAIGEDLSSPTAGTSNCRAERSTFKQKLIDQAIQKQVVSASSAGLFESQHVWRPQRGLPERAVSILRAWLFDHFLHPYPTDTDKHMLATQTGLTRNQVSNWFINARVRVWKPMVEEIHMLEAKGLGESSGLHVASEADDNASHANQSKATSDGQRLIKFTSGGTPDDLVERSGNAASASGAGNRLNQQDMWNQEKRSRTDYQTPTSIVNESLIGFAPYHRTGIEIGGLGSVSLTLGLRQSSEAAQQQQQQSQSDIMQHFGGHQMIHNDFVG